MAHPKKVGEKFSGGARNPESLKKIFIPLDPVSWYIQGYRILVQDFYQLLNVLAPWIIPSNRKNQQYKNLR
jgi:hypothetical protein